MTPSARWPVRSPGVPVRAYDVDDVGADDGGEDGDDDDDVF